MTELSKFNDAFATVKVATYQPIIVKWVSGIGLQLLMQDLIRRFPAKLGNARLALSGGDKTPTALRYDWSRKATVKAGFAPPKEIADADARTMEDPDDHPAASVPSLPMARMQIPPRNWKAVDGQGERKVIDVGLAVGAIPGTKQDLQRGFQNARAILKLFREDAASPGDLIEGLKKANIPIFLPTIQIEEGLSPIGLAHFYRQLYFDLETGVGPIEQAFSIAPKETLELVHETVRREVYEMTEEFGSETTLEHEQATRTLEEISDSVASSISRDSQVAMSLDVSGEIGVYNVGAQASAGFSTATEQSRERVTKNSREVTTRNAETIRKSHKVTVRQMTDFTETSTTRRTVSNEGDIPVSYGLRRVLRKVRVKVQDIGPRLCWQVYVCDPGLGLAQSKFVHFSEAEPMATPDIPPGAPPKPEAKVETGNQTVFPYSLSPDPMGVFPWITVVDIRIIPPPDYEIDTVVFDHPSDPDPDKNAEPPSMHLHYFERDPDGPRADGSVVFRQSIVRGSAQQVTVSYTVHLTPSQAVMDAWHTAVQEARDKAEYEAMEQQFEKQKKLITLKSRVRRRPSRGLRDEERFEIMNRMISELFRAGGSSGKPDPVEIEYFHRYFDERSIFYYTHPSWWVPRLATGQGLSREEYEVTEQSEPAPMGKSLGWRIQIDGDRRRNEFLNSPWVRVCVPIKPGREREAIEWLAEHLEGQNGFDLDDGSDLADLLAAVEAQRAAEAETTGPNYVTLDGTVAPTNTDAADAYPVVDEFDIVLPTEGFVYDQITIAE